MGFQRVIMIETLFFFVAENWGKAVNMLRKLAAEDGAIGYRYAYNFFVCLL